MDAGVPLSAPVAGIAMGLIKEGDDFAVLSDILGDEDHLGDMDFKVTGTTKGITAFQMDVKISTVTRDIMSKALAQAREGRLHILAEMDKTLSAGREEALAVRSPHHGHQDQRGQDPRRDWTRWKDDPLHPGQAQHRADC